MFRCISIFIISSIHSLVTSIQIRFFLLLSIRIHYTLPHISKYFNVVYFLLDIELSFAFLCFKIISINKYFEKCRKTIKRDIFFLCLARQNSSLYHHYQNTYTQLGDNCCQFLDLIKTLNSHL